MQIIITYKEIEQAIKEKVSEMCSIPEDRFKVTFTNEMKLKDKNITASVELLDEK
jgi:hypothetical protein